MFTTIGWSESQDSGGVLVNVAGIPDQSVTVTADDIVVPNDLPNLAGVIAIGATISLARIEAPSLRRMVLLDVDPLNIGAEPIFPSVLNQKFDNPIALDPAESLRAQVAEGAAGAEQETVIAWLSDGPLAPVSGEIFRIRATSATTLVAFTWGNCPLTLGQTLPAGRYQVVGMSALSAGCLAARLVFVGYQWRPGCVGVDALSDGGDMIFRNGSLGVWGEFEHTQPPTVDFLSVSADTAETVFLDLIKVG